MARSFLDISVNILDVGVFSIQVPPCTDAEGLRRLVRLKNAEFLSHFEASEFILHNAGSYSKDQFENLTTSIGLPDIPDDMRPLPTQVVLTLPHPLAPDVAAQAASALAAYGSPRLSNRYRAASARLPDPSTPRQSTRTPRFNESGRASDPPDRATTGGAVAVGPTVAELARLVADLSARVGDLERAVRSGATGGRGDPPVGMWAGAVRAGDADSYLPGGSGGGVDGRGGTGSLLGNGGGVPRGEVEWGAGLAGTTGSPTDVQPRVAIPRLATGTAAARGGVGGVGSAAAAPYGSGWHSSRGGTATSAYGVGAGGVGVSASHASPSPSPVPTATTAAAAAAAANSAAAGVGEAAAPPTGRAASADVVRLLGELSRTNAVASGGLREEREWQTGALVVAGDAARSPRGVTAPYLHLATRGVSPSPSPPTRRGMGVLGGGGSYATMGAASLTPGGSARQDPALLSHRRWGVDGAAESLPPRMYGEKERVFGGTVPRGLGGSGLHERGIPQPLGADGWGGNTSRSTARRPPVEDIESDLRASSRKTKSKHASKSKSGKDSRRSTRRRRGETDSSEDERRGAPVAVPAPTPVKGRASRRRGGGEGSDSEGEDGGRGVRDGEKGRSSRRRGGESSRRRREGDGEDGRGAVSPPRGLYGGDLSSPGRYDERSTQRGGEVGRGEGSPKGRKQTQRESERRRRRRRETSSDSGSGSGDTDGSRSTSSSKSTRSTSSDGSSTDSSTARGKRRGKGGERQSGRGAVVRASPSPVLTRQDVFHELRAMEHVLGGAVATAARANSALAAITNVGAGSPPPDPE